MSLWRHNVCAKPLSCHPQPAQCEPRSCIVGINCAPNYTSYEGEREWPTNGKKHKHPIQEAEEAESRLISRAAPSFDEFQVIRFRATNVKPFPFEWADYDQTAKEYSALLVRLSREYDQRFP